MTAAPDSQSRDQIAAQLARELQETPRLTARDLARLTGVSKSMVNSVLYARKGTFVHSDDSRPRWSLVHGNSVQVREVPAGQFADADPDGAEDPINESDLYRWQVEALDAWRAQDRQGIIEAVTGSGKTRVGITAIREQVEDAGRAVVIVPTIELMHQWKRELDLRLPAVPTGLFGDGANDTLDDCSILVSVVNSARAFDLGLQPDGRNLLVADECHRYASEENRKALEDGFDARLGLTATLERSDGLEDEVLLPYFGPVAYRIGYRQAIDEEVVARFDVIAIGVNLTRSELAEYEELSEKLSKARSNLINNFGVPAEPFEEFLRAVNQMKHGSMREGIAAGRFWSSFSKRRDLLARTDVKNQALADLSEAIKGAGRTLVFTQTIESAERAAGTLGERGVAALAVHSKTDRDERHAALAAFGSGTYQVLVAPRILDEGIDVPEADLGVIVAASLQRRQMIQRMGRVLRRKHDGRKARFVVLYARGTTEDPAGGAHEVFFDEIGDVADSIKHLSVSDAVRELERNGSPHIA